MKRKTLIAPERFPVFYGWVVVAMGTLGLLSSIPGQTVGVSVFTDHLMQGLALSRNQVSLAYLAGTLASGFLVFYGGKLVDLIGVRKMIVIATTGLGMSLVLIANSGWIASRLSRIAAPGFRIEVSMAVLFVSFLCIRFFGQGLMAMTPRVMIGKWFDHRRGLAIGISGLFSSFGFGVAPLMLNRLIHLFGWQGAYLTMALGISLGMGTLGWLFFREQPEDHGLRKDGVLADDAQTSKTSGKPSKPVRQFTISEARRSYSFWIFTAGLSAQGFVLTAITFHILSIGENAGLSDDQALSLFMPISIIGIFSTLFAGWISDKTKLKYLLMIMMLCQAAGICGFLTMATLWGRVALVIGFGLASGLWGTLVGVVWPRFFGTLHLGSITGLNMAVMVVSTAFGPYLLSLSHSSTGSYALGLTISLALPLTIFFAAFRANNPQEEFV